MAGLVLVALLSLVTVQAAERVWDPRYARLRGVSKDGAVLFNGGNHNDGRWDCPWNLDGFECADGSFTCKCNGGREVKFTIGCCYKFPSCGDMCHNWSCYRYRNCETCKSRVSEWDMRACAACKKGFVYEGGLCDTDLNECAYNNGNCDQVCHNTYGSYYCTCVDGFRLEEDKHSCERLSCPAISETPDVAVQATEDWLFHSYAKFKVKEKSMTLNGAELAGCLASGTHTYWDTQRPAAIDTCQYVKLDDRVRCPNTPDDVSKEKCLQLGCCYQDLSNAASCYLNPVKSYIRFGGVSPVPSEAKGFVSYENHNSETSAHLCHHSHGPESCKAFGIEQTGKNDSHAVHFQVTYMLTKNKQEYEDQGLLVENAHYDMYESVTFDPSQPRTPETVSSVSKQYVGCYKDNATSRDLAHHVMRSSTHMDPAYCIAICRHQSYKFAGVQNGVDCYCGNGVYRKHGESEECTTPCSGDSSQKCGGSDDNSVYSVAWSDSYRGCYKDDTESRDLPFFVWGKDAGRSAAECSHECAKRKYAYAGLQGGGVCYCGDSYGAHGAAEERECSSRCYGYARQNCGGSLFNAVYQTDLAAEISSSSIGSTVSRLYDESGALSGISTNLFTFYPDLRTILSKRLIIHAGGQVLTPAEVTCGKDCYTPCGDVHHDTRIKNKGSDVTLRFFYLDLSKLDDYVGDAAKRVYVHAQTVLIDRDVKLDYALYLRAQTLIVDRSKALYIDVPSDAQEFDIDITKDKFNDPEADTLHQKQSMMCAQILLNTRDKTHVATSFSILHGISSSASQRRETQAVVATARNMVAEVAGLARANVRFVPYYTKAHLKKILDNYFEKISIYDGQLKKLVTEGNTKDAILDYVEGMHKIYSDTDIMEAQTGFEASLDAVERTNATYQRFRHDYQVSRDLLEEARVVFEKGLDEKKGWEIGRFVIKVIASIAKATVGGLESGGESPDEEIDGIEIDILELFGLLQELSETIAQIDELSEVADKIVDELEHLSGEFEAVRYYDEVEMSVQLQVNIIKWKNLKNYGETLLSQEDIAAVRGAADYHRHLLDVCNWGEALTRSMVERAEMIRESMEKRAVLDLKKEQKERIDEHIAKYRADLYDGELLINEMVEQSYDVRLDLNDVLLTFCQAYYYENMFECKPAYQPSFGGSLEHLLLKLNSAKRDDLLVGAAPSTVRRYITLEDKDTDPLCNDATQCPINYLRKNRLLYFNVPTDHPDLRDMDAYKVAEIILTFNGAKTTTDNKYLKVQIESSGYFQGRANSVVHNFLTRALSLAFEYDITNGYITVRADVYKPFRNIIQHITPFTNWVMRISDLRSKDIDLSAVTSVRVQFDGSGIDNETWRKRRAEAHAQ